MKLTEIKARLQAVLMAFRDMELEGGLKIEWAGDEELAVGDEVTIYDAEGKALENPDGEYIADAKKITILDSKVEAIEDVEKPAEEPAEPAEPAAEPEKPAEEMEDEQPAEPAAEPDEKDARIAELEARIAELEKENEELKARIAELEKEPAAPSAEEEFERHIEPAKTGNKKLDRLAEIMASKR